MYLLGHPSVTQSMRATHSEVNFPPNNQSPNTQSLKHLLIIITMITHAIEQIYHNNDDTHIVSKERQHGVKR